MTQSSEREREIKFKRKHVHYVFFSYLCFIKKLDYLITYVLGPIPPELFRPSRSSSSLVDTYVLGPIPPVVVVVGVVVVVVVVAVVVVVVVM